ncbi:hypothetical protein PVAND_005177 [Polypedilum vanderplanki]|uniref:Uncharacterized protein n=1 Tax=Polypedilum vanderplanki TaxID=319348 RepID=A0A9J6C1A1_POLVA|nr:hypothetical protein PVAND_005177 [Polypedilum vanderplanki]
MKVIKNFFKVSALVVFLVASAAGLKRIDHECGNQFYPYNLDNEPAINGLSAEQYAPGKEAYVGLNLLKNIAFQFNRIQLNPPGVNLYNPSGISTFSNDSSKIWYLYNNPNHTCKWVDCPNIDFPPNSIQVASDLSGYQILAGRIVRPNGLVYVGLVLSIAKIMLYVDENNLTQIVPSGYQILTCKSSVKNEMKYPAPYYDFPTTPDPDVGCINNWQPYNNDDAPSKNGVAAGTFDVNNIAYVGKVKLQQYIDGVVIPGRIQINHKSGIFTSNAGKTIFIANGSYYLVNNPNYSYYWVSFNGTGLPTNAVYARDDIGKLKHAIGRLETNGQTQIGYVTNLLLVLTNNGNGDELFNRYEVLVCDPWPKI